MAQTQVEVATTAARKDEAETRAWAVAKRLPIFGYGEIEVEAHVSRPVSVELVNRWLEKRMIRLRPVPGHAGRKMFEVTPATRDLMDRVVQLRQQLWTTARGLKVFSGTDLAAHCTPEVGATKPEVSAYCQMLLRGGYLKVVQLASPPNREAKYRLIRDTGPKAPREKRVTAVWDENEVRYVHIPGHLVGARTK